MDFSNEWNESVHELEIGFGTEKLIDRVRRRKYGEPPYQSKPGFVFVLKQGLGFFCSYQPHGSLIFQPVKSHAKKFENRMLATDYQRWLERETGKQVELVEIPDQRAGALAAFAGMR